MLIQIFCLGNLLFFIAISVWFFVCADSCRLAIAQKVICCFKMQSDLFKFIIEKCRRYFKLFEMENVCVCVGISFFVIQSTIYVFYHRYVDVKWWKLTIRTLTIRQVDEVIKKTTKTFSRFWIYFMASNLNSIRNIKSE